MRMMTGLKNYHAFLVIHVLLTILSVTEEKLSVVEGSVGTLRRDDIGMVFSITLHNTDLCPYDIKVNMLECVEFIDARDSDSTFMYLIGGYMGKIKSQCFKNITLLYPNMVLHNRKGYCMILIRFKGRNNIVKNATANITFDTWMNKKKTPTILSGFYKKSEVHTCETVDLDPLNKCKPYDCHMKYLGTRNYWNKKWKRCQKVPICIADLSKEMPDMIYSLRSNKCKDMDKTVTKVDLQAIDAGTSRGPCDENYQSFVNINCHYGKYDNVTGLCNCDEGWISPTVDKDQSDAANLFVYHMCNIEVQGIYDTSSKMIKVSALIIGILAVVIAMLIIIVSFLIHVCFNGVEALERRRRLRNCPSVEAKRKKSPASEKTRLMTPESGSSARSKGSVRYSDDIESQKHKKKRQRANEKECAKKKKQMLKAIKNKKGSSTQSTSTYFCTPTDDMY